jgi:hypothetical protein
MHYWGLCVLSRDLIRNRGDHPQRTRAVAHHEQGMRRDNGLGLSAMLFAGLNPPLTPA